MQRARCRSPKKVGLPGQLREPEKTERDELPPPTLEYVPQLVKNGACLYLPPSIMQVPIPLIDIRMNASREFIWATIQTPFGSQKPLFELIHYASQDRLEYGSAFSDAEDARLCTIIDVRALAIPDYTRDKLIKKAQEHARRMSEDAAYKRRWDQHFAVGLEDCISGGQ